MTPPYTNHPLRLLLVDDQESNRELVRLYLGTTPVAVTEAATASQALRLFVAQPYDVVLVDMILPDLHGAELVQRLRCLEQQLERPPVAILAVTALEAQDIAGDMAYDGLLRKPFTPQQLLAALPQLTVEPGGDHQHDAVLVDPLLESLVPRLMANLRHLVDQSASSLAAQDGLSLQQHGHSLKGVAMTFGLEALALVGRELEAAATAGDFAAARGSLRRAQELLPRLRFRPRAN